MFQIWPTLNASLKSFGLSFGGNPIISRTFSRVSPSIPRYNIPIPVRILDGENRRFASFSSGFSVKIQNEHSLNSFHYGANIKRK